MAIYHCSIKIISRGKGKSAVAAAAYRAGEKITNNYDGITHDYTRKSGVVHTEILLPDHAPKEYIRRAVLWNAVEQIEKAKNSQLAREIELALPIELTHEQNILLVRNYVNQHFVSAGMCADVCLHDTNGGNPHAHILLTMRPIEQNGTWGAKARKVDGRKISTMDWNSPTKAEQWRAGWARTCNDFFERQSMAERVDHRSYERQNIEQIPTVHLGVAATQMERKGIVTERGDYNREIIVTNRQLRQLKARIKQLKQQPNLREQVKELQHQLWDVRDNMRFFERRIDILNEHIRQGEFYLAHRKFYREYTQLKPKKQQRFYEENRAALMLFEAAKRHFEKHNVRRVNIQDWREERQELAVEKSKVYREYNALKDKVWETEKMARNEMKRQRSLREQEGVRRGNTLVL